MTEFLGFLKTFEVWIYILVGVMALVYFRRLLRARNEWQLSLFGLERENARARFARALSMFVLAVLLGLGEFVVTSFVVPNTAGLQPLSTPTVNPLGPTTEGGLSSVGTGTPGTAGELLGRTQGVTPGAVTVMVSGTPVTSGCIPGQIEWTSPKDGSQVQGKVELRGTVQVSDFGFYQYAFRSASGEQWTVLAAGNQMGTDEVLGGVWDTTQLAAGAYQLQLLVANSQNNWYPACIINVNVTAAEGT